MFRRISTLLILLFVSAMVTAPSYSVGQQLAQADMEILLDHIVTHAVSDANRDTGKEFEKVFVDILSVSAAFEQGVAGSRAAVESTGSVPATRDDIIDERLIPYISHGVPVTIGDRRIKDDGLMVKFLNVRRAKNVLSITVETATTNPKPRIHDDMVRYVLRGRKLEFQFLRRGQGWKLLGITVIAVS